MNRYRRCSASKIQQTAILRDVEIPEVHRRRGRAAQVDFATYPWLVVLNQDCDLDLDHHARRGTSPTGGGQPVRQDKILRSVLLCAAFPENEVLAGTYIAGANEFRGTQAGMVLEDRHERYHVLHPEPPFLHARLIMDFKLVIASQPDYIERWIRQHPQTRVAVLRPPYRDRLTQRFANYFVRIAEP